MEVTQFTYFQQVGGLDCDPVSGEITYGLERLAMYVQGVETSTTSNSTAAPAPTASPMAKCSCRPSEEYSALQFRARRHRDPVRGISTMPRRSAGRCSAGGDRAPLALPAYDQCIKASHLFNLLDARGVISVTERAGLHPAASATLAKACCEAWLAAAQRRPARRRAGSG